MLLKKEELKVRLLEIIADIGKRKDDGFVYFKKDKLLLKWEACGLGKFKDHRHGKIWNFLERELSAEKHDDDGYRLRQPLSPDVRDVKHGIPSMATPKKISKTNTGDEDTLEMAVPLAQLKNEMYELILGYLERRARYKEDEGTIRASVTLEQLNLEWQRAYPKRKFKDCNCGTFKLFLIEKCHLKESGKDQFEVDSSFIKSQLQPVKSESELVARPNTYNPLAHAENPFPHTSGHGPSQQTGQSPPSTTATTNCEWSQSDDLWTKAGKNRMNDMPPENRAPHSRFNERDKANEDVSERATTVNILPGACAILGDVGKLSTNNDLPKDNEYCKAHDERILSKLDTILGLIKEGQSRKVPQEEIYDRVKSRVPEAEWDEWINVSGILGSFNPKNNQYMLIIDRFNESEKDLAKILEGIHWKLILDLDPDSDNTGVFARIEPRETQGGLIETRTPGRIFDSRGELLIDSNKMQWVFANGRNMCSEAMEENPMIAKHGEHSDTPKSSFCEWKRHFKIPITQAIRVMSEKLDPMKPVICIILGVRPGLSSEIATLLLEEIQGIFLFNRFTMRFIAVDSEVKTADLDQSNFTTSNLSFVSFMTCIASQMGIYGKEDFLVPGKFSESFVSLKKYFNFLSEYLEILYKGCEDIPQHTNKEDKNSFEKEHLKKFLSGNPISFPSLSFRHDATRNLTSEITNHIAKLTTKMQKPQILQITHAPGSGGTTIARRVLWDLHKTNPCAIVKVNFFLENFSQDSDGDKYADNICDRINCLEDKCKSPPVILIDGRSSLVRILSDYVARNLKEMAIIIRCINRNEGKNDNLLTDKNYRMYLNRVFELNPDLEADENRGDHTALIAKYEYYQSELQLSNKFDRSHTPRVYHFPLMVMMGEFKNLENIVRESLEELAEEKPKEYEVALMVAFLQLYADRATPASLIADYIIKKKLTYEELTASFSVTLMNLMIPEEAPKRRQFSRKFFRKSSPHLEASEEWSTVQQYTFQHPKVAEQVFRQINRSLDVVTEMFLSYNILQEYGRKGNEEIKDTVNSLFLHNKSDGADHFSKLILQLQKEPHGGRIFEDAARQSQDVSFYSHVARFFAYRKSDFKKARRLIEDGFKAENNIPADKKRRVLDTFGHIVLQEIKKADIPSIDDLKVCAQEALDLFRQARDSHPRMFPNPLIGEVMIWLFCLEYLIRRMGNNLDTAIEFALKDEFFSEAIPECIALLDEVDEMVVAGRKLSDPRQTERLAYEKRCKLRDIITRTRSPTERGGWQETFFFTICYRIAQYEKKVPEKVLIKLQARWLMNEVGNNFLLLSKEDRIMLFEWLYKLVHEYKMFDHARYLIEVASLHKESLLEFETAFEITKLWKEKYPNDLYSYFYQYMLCFVKICNSEISDYKARYESALESCIRATQDRLDQHRPKYYVGKVKGSICSLVSHAELVSIAAIYNPERRGRGRKEDEIDQSFWEKHCLEHLLQCHGRIRYVRRKFEKSRTFILMEPGLIEINVVRNAVGRPYQDYQPDSKVSFIVGLTAAGPKAREITFH